MLSNGVKILYNHVTILLLLLYTYIPLGLIHLFPGYCWTRAVPYTHSKLLSWRTRSDPWWVSIPEARKITFFPPLYFSFSVLLSIISQRYMLIYEFPSPCFSLKHDISFKSLSFFFPHTDIPLFSVNLTCVSYLPCLYLNQLHLGWQSMMWAGESLLIT